MKNRISYWSATFYHIALLLLAASIPNSKYTTSIFQFVVMGFWLFHNSDIKYIEEFKKGARNFPLRFIRFFRDFLISIFNSLIAKFREFFKNKAALAVTSLLFLHVIGLLYTSDFHYAFKDLRTKLPLLLLPLFFSTGPKVNTRTLYLLLTGYAFAIFGGTIYRLVLYFNLSVADPRAIDAHTSHIRFSLNAVFAIFILFYFVRLHNFFTSWQKTFLIILAIWFVFFMIYLRYTTGLSILVIVAIIVLLFEALKGSSIKRRIIFLVSGLALLIAPIVYFSSVVKQFYHKEQVYFPQLDAYTIQGNSYYHDTVNFRVENGQYVGLYICEKELRKSWAQRSKMLFDSLDSKQQVLRYTLIRYLASKNLRKDSVGVAHLTSQDIQKIEAGMTNPNNGNGFNIRTQINNFLNGWDNYRRYGNANSSSLLQRFEYWRTSLILIKQHLLFGVGTGDAPDAFSQQYEKIKSSLDPKNRLRSHNQFLSITVTFGIIGLLWFIFSLIYPMIITKGYHNYLYMIFWLIFMISIFTEDTIESQEGLTFYAYFTSLFLFALINNEVKEEMPDKVENQTELY